MSALKAEGKDCPEKGKRKRGRRRRRNEKCGTGTSQLGYFFTIRPPLHSRSKAGGGSGWGEGLQLSSIGLMQQCGLIYIPLSHIYPPPPPAPSLQWRSSDCGGVYARWKAIFVKIVSIDYYFLSLSFFLSFFLSFSLSLSAVYLNLSLSSLFISLSVFLFVYFLSILLISIFSCHNFSSRTYVGYVYLFDVFVSVHCAVLAIWLVCFVFWVLGTFMHLLACSLIILSTYVFSVLTSANLSSKLHVNVTVNRLIDSI